jgi:hypothetical protein
MKLQKKEVCHVILKLTKKLYGFHPYLTGKKQKQQIYQLQTNGILCII